VAELQNSNALSVATLEKFDCIFCYEALLMFFAGGLQTEFLESLLNKLDINGILILTGIRSLSMSLPKELQWAKQKLLRKNFFVDEYYFKSNESFYPYISAKLNNAKL